MAVTFGKSSFSLGAERRIGRVSDQLYRSLERLSSGSRINRASDDAAGLAVFSQLRVQSRVFSQGVRNLNDGVSYLNIASATLTEASGITMRLRELATQSANGTLSLTQRRSLDEESDSLVSEFNRILSDAKFNGVSIFSEENFNLVLQSGFGSDGALSLRNGSELARKRGIGTFTGATTATSSANDLVAADINGDGFADSIQASGSNVIVRTGNGDGTFSSSASTYVMGAGAVSGLRIADINGDGINDLVARMNNNLFSIATGISGGTFSSASSIANPSGSSDFALVDFNSDNRVDIVSLTSGGVYLLSNDGSGSFSSASQIYSRSMFGSALYTGDLDGDSTQDLFITYAGSNISLFGSGTGSIRSAVVQSNTYSSAAVTGLGDFNSDGYVDLVQYDAFTGSGLQISYGNGNGTYSLSSANSFSLSNIMSELLVADLNGDGHLDIYTTGAAGASRTLMGNGDGSFTVTSTASAGTAQIAAGDINNDGVLDILSISSTTLTGRTHQTIQTGELEYLNLNTRAGALEAIDILEQTLTRLTQEQGKLGGHLARLDVSLRLLSNQSDELLSAASRINDVDIAEESANQIRLSLLQETGAAILGQATQATAIALTLLR